MEQIKFKGKRIDTKEWVSGYYFVAPLTDENSGTDPEAGWFFLNTPDKAEWHCISTEEGVVYVVEGDSVEAESLLSMVEENQRLRELIEWLDQECPEGTEGTFDLSHDFIQKLRHRIENIKEK